MSISAMNWAWNQNIPYVAAKLLLMALADQTDQRDGSVRYQETFAEFFSAKCTISVRTFWTAIGLLELNRYLERSGHKGGGRGKQTEFRLLLDRQASTLEEWRKAEDGDENNANLAEYSDEKLCEIVQKSVKIDVENREAAITVSAKDIISNQSTKESTSAHARARDAKATRTRARNTVAGAVSARWADPLDTVFSGPGLRSYSDLLKILKGRVPPLQYVCEKTQQWREVEAYYLARGQAMPAFLYPGDQPRQYSGSHIPSPHVRKAGEEAKTRATGPPDDSDDDATTFDDATTTAEQGGTQDVSSGRQSATGVRSVAGALADRGRDRPGTDSSAYG